MHQAQIFVDKVAARINPSRLSDYVFDVVSSNIIKDCLMDDASNYVYSAAISIADAINGIRRGLVSWATVKLYYSVYYACRGILALNSVGIIYVGGTPFTLDANPGNKIIKRNGQTHKIVLNEFSVRNIEYSLLSQEIDLQPPLDWLMGKREIANYKNSRFWEPGVPDYFKKIFDIGIRKSINGYFTDFDLYAFDPEHAILAYPIKSLKIAYELLDARGKKWEIDDKKYIMNLFKDNNGPLTEICRIFQ